MKIYFAHATKDYNTLYELKCIDEINKMYPKCDIINPKNIIVEKQKNSFGSLGDLMKDMENYFFPQIDNCDLIIVSKNKSGKIYGGTQLEINYALKKGIKIKYLDVTYPKNNLKIK